MDEAALERMSVKELRELKDRIDDAIRAYIVKQRVEREGVRTPDGQSAPVPIDLEAERDAWAARRK